MQLHLDQLLSHEPIAFSKLLTQFSRDNDVSNWLQNCEQFDREHIDQSARAQFAQAVYDARARLATWNSAQLNSLIEQLQTDYHNKNTSLPEALLAELRLAFASIEQLRQSMLLDQQVARQLSLFYPVLLAYAVSSDTFWFRSHPVKKLFEILFEQTIGLSPDTGAQAKKEFDILISALDKLIVHQFGSTEDMFNIMSVFRTALRDSRQRILRLHERLKASEMGKLQQSKAKTDAQYMLMHVAAGRPLPQYWLKLLDSWILPQLSFDFLQSNRSSSEAVFLELEAYFLKFYRNAEAALFETVDASHFQALIAYVPQAESDLCRALKSDREFFDHQQFLDISQRHKDWLSYERFADLDIAASVDLSSSLESELAMLAQGDWFLLNGQEASAPDTASAQRLCLIMIDKAFDQYLLVNGLGQKVLALTAAQLAAQLAANGLVKISQSRIIDKSLAPFYRDMLDNYDRQLEALQAMQTQDSVDSIDQEAQQALMAEEAMKALAEAELLEQQANRHEIHQHGDINQDYDLELGSEPEPISEFKPELKSELKPKFESKPEFQIESGIRPEQSSVSDTSIPDDLIRKLKLAIDSMLIGAWVEFIDTDADTVQKLKLAVKFAATQRFVFVNPEGITEKELQREQIMQGVINKTIRILETDRYFADRLQGILLQIDQHVSDD